MIVQTVHGYGMTGDSGTPMTGLGYPRKEENKIKSKRPIRRILQ